MNRSEALSVLNSIPMKELRAMCLEARDTAFTRRVRLCAIMNCRNGACSEDCAFCAQSHSQGSDMLSLQEMKEAHRSVTDAGIDRFSAVTSGRGVSWKDLGRVCLLAEAGKDLCPLCASLGIINRSRLKALKRSGISRYHHNIESSERFFQQICTTHSWKERVETASAAREEGLSLCSGGIIGIGECDEDRVDMAFMLNTLKADSIALNFYLDVPGTKISGEDLSREKLFRIIALFRLVNPESELRVCAGRAKLEDRTGLMFDYGVTGLMTGSLLTTEGTAPEEDIELVRESGYRL